MIITLIVVVLLVLSILGMFLYEKDLFSYDIGEFILGASIVGVIISITGFLICVICIIDANCAVERQIYNNTMNRESIIKQVEYINSDYEDISKTAVIKSVYDWNIKVYNTKYRSSNPWTSWLYNKRVANAMEYIDLETLK